MNMRKSISLIIVIFVAVIFFCIKYSNNNTIHAQGKKDYAIITQCDGKKVGKITNSSDIDEISSLIGRVGRNPRGMWRNKDTKKYIYHYEITQGQPKVKINVYIYKNGEIYIKNMPIISKGVWKLSQKDYKTLTQVNKFKID